MLSQIRIVLINTSHPGNIGSVARAMKTMGLTELCLVAPRSFPHSKANELAAGALDVLAQATVVPQLHDAISDCQVVIGTSARSRSLPWPMCSPRELAEKIRQEFTGAKTAILFGCEQSGLSNEALQSCHLHVQIPSNPAYSSLYLAAAVQVITYELRVASLSPDPSPMPWDCTRANAAELETFYQHLEETLIQVGFLNPLVPRQLLPRLRRLFNRAYPDTMEINILRGVLTAINKHYTRTP